MPANKKETNSPQAGRSSGKAPKKNRRWVRFLIYGCILAILLVLVGLTTFIASLPTIVSTAYVKQAVTEQVSKTLQRPVTIKRLQWGWTTGLALEALQIPDDPRFSKAPLFALDSLYLDIDYRQLLSQEVVFDLTVHGIKANIIRDETGQSNLSCLLAAFSTEPQPVEESGHSKAAPHPPQTSPPSGKQGKAAQKSAIPHPQAPWANWQFTLPVNLKTTIDLDHIQLVMEDRQNKRRLAIQDAGIGLHVPSLFNQPVTLNVASTLILDDQPLPKAQIDLTLQKLFQPDGRLDLAAAGLNFNALLPGIHIDIQGQAADKGLQAQLALNLPEIYALAAPFLPAELQTAALTGHVQLTLNAQGDPLRRIRLHQHLTVTGLGLSGGPLKEKRLTPINGEIDNGAVFNVVEDQLTELKGHLNLLSGTRLTWSGEITQLSSQKPYLDCKLGPLYVDLDELMAKVADFIPPSLQFPGGLQKARAALHLAAIDFSGTLPPATTRIKAEKLKVSLSEVRFKTQAQDVTLTPSPSTEALVVTLDSLDFAGFLTPGRSKATVKDLLIQVPRLEARLPGKHLQTQNLELRLNALTSDLVDLKPVQNDLQLGLRLDDLKWVQKHPPAPAAKEGTKTPPSPPKETNLHLANLDCHLNPVKTSLENLFPTEAQLGLNLAVGTVELAGEPKFACHNMELKALTVSAKHIRQHDQTLAGVTAAVTLNNHLHIGQIELPAQMSLANIDQRLALKGNLEATPSAQFALEALTLNIPQIRTAVGKTPITCGVDLNLKVAGIDVKRADHLVVDIRDARLKTQVEDVATLNLGATVKDLGAAQIDTQGRLELKLTPLSTKFLSVLSPNIIPQMNLNGTGAILYRFSGRLPSAAEKKRLSQPAFNLATDIPFLDQFDLRVALHQVGLKMSLPNQQQVDIAVISTPRALHYELHPAADNGRLDLKLTVNGITHLPTRKLDPPLNADFEITADHQGFHALQIKQSLTTRPIKLRETFSATLENVDRWLQKAPPLEPLWALKYLSGQAQAHLDVFGSTALEKTLQDVKINGTVSAGAEVKLIADQSLGAKAWLLSPGINLRLPERAAVSQLKSNLLLEKTLRIQEKGAASQSTSAEDQSRLSARVMQPPTTQMESPPDELLSDRLVSNRAGQRLITELKGKFNPLPSLSFQSLLLGQPAQGFQVDHTRLEFQMDQGLPGIKYFQTDLLNGTAQGAFSIFQEGSTFYLRLQLAFSGLDTAQLIPEATVSGPPADSEVSGQLLLIVPLVTRMKPLLDQLWLDLQFSHIGSRTLERLLFALDPTESNEAIVEKRKLLKSGSPRWIKISIKDSEFAFDGKVDIKGIGFKPVAISGINIANLQAIHQYERHLLRLLPLLEGLRLTSAKTLLIDKGHSRFGLK